MTRIFWCEHLHQPEGWLSPGVIEVADDGMITRVTSADEKLASVTERLAGWIVPGMANVHSHAFQRALVGLAEWSAPGRDDSFWSWREAMYELALAMTPDDLEAIAAQLYVEMLEAGMTAVGEFHYLHHDRDGAHFGDRAETSRRIVSAAETAGIGLTHLPVLYLHGGFGAPPGDRQRRFVHANVDDFLITWEAIASALAADAAAPRGLLRLGVAPHSLRAVDPASLARVVSEIGRQGGAEPPAPVHIHIAEQAREVAEAEVHLGARPVAWLAREHALDERWCLVHATHIDEAEVVALQQSGAVVGLCPSTEANLGDGLFPARAFAAGGGRSALGSDSHVTVDVASEIRTLEYGQRLRHQRRNILASAEQVHVGRHLFDHCARWGAVAVAQPLGALIPGRRADLVALEGDHPRLYGHGPETVLDAWIFGAAAGAIRDVFVAGEPMVRDGRHRRRESISGRFRGAMRRLATRA